MFEKWLLLNDRRTTRLILAATPGHRSLYDDYRAAFIACLAYDGLAPFAKMLLRSFSVLIRDRSDYQIKGIVQILSLRMARYRLLKRLQVNDARFNRHL